MADTRTPFDGVHAFNRNSQQYVPFNTPSDAMIASLVLAYRLAAPVLSVVLAIVRHPQFNPTELTLQKADDIWVKVAEHEEKLAAASRTRTARNSGFAFNFPQVVVDEVVDLLEREKEEKVHVQRDMQEPQLDRVKSEVVDRDLRSMSLVCRAWTQPAQRAIGRILILSNLKVEHLQNALNGPLFGPWTRELIVFRCNRVLDTASRNCAHKQSNESWQLIARLLTRVPKVRSACLNTDVYEHPSVHMAEGFSRMPSLQELRLVHIGDISSLLGNVLKNIGRIPSLKHLSLQYSGAGSVYSTYVPPSDLTNSCPSPTFESLSLKIGNVSELSLKYINWLVTPRPEGFTLKSLLLDLSSCYRNEAACVRALEPAFPTLDTLYILVSGLSDGIISSIFRKCTSLRRVSISMRHFLMHSCFDDLPRCLEDVLIDYSYDEAEAKWDEWDEKVKDFLGMGYCANLRRLIIRMPFYDADEAEKFDHKFVPNAADRFPLSFSYAEEANIDFDVQVASRHEYQYSTHITHSWV